MAKSVMSKTLSLTMKPGRFAISWWIHVIGCRAKKVLIAPRWIDRVSWNDSKVYVSLSREAIKNAPEYHPDALTGNTRGSFTIITIGRSIGIFDRGFKELIEVRGKERDEKAGAGTLPVQAAAGPVSPSQDRGRAMGCQEAKIVTVS